MSTFEDRARSANNVEHFIALVQELESYAFHDPHREWTAEDVANACRLTRYEGMPWPDLVKRQDPFPHIRDLARTGDLEARINAVMGHGPISNGRESGTNLDFFGNRVAVGHTVTGVVAGLRHDRSAKFMPQLLVTGDNVTLATITGDLGQCVGEVYDSNVGAAQAVYDAPGMVTGVGHGATTAELNGDFDGMLLGLGFGWSTENSQLRSRMTGTAMVRGGPRFSDFLLGYYWPTSAQGPMTMMYGGSPIRVDFRWHNIAKYLNENMRALFEESMTIAGPYSLFKNGHVMSGSEAGAYMRKLFHTLVLWFNLQARSATGAEH